MPDGAIAQCYAKTIADKFRSDKMFPDGFEHHYFMEERLQEPLKVKEPSGIFVGSMADLFGHWVERAQIEAVLNITRQAHWHIFQTLSKAPHRLIEFNPFPDNVWVGVSIPAGHMMKETGAARALQVYLDHLSQVKARIRFVSIEPLWFDVGPVFEAWIKKYGKLPFEWAIIGAASNGTKLYQPKTEWVNEALRVLDAQQIPIFFKGNLEWGVRRESFPVLRKAEQMRMF
jgi:protein gp37